MLLICITTYLITVSNHVNYTAEISTVYSTLYLYKSFKVFMQHIINAKQGV